MARHKHSVWLMMATLAIVVGGAALYAYAHRETSGRFVPVNSYDLTIDTVAVRAINQRILRVAHSTDVWSPFDIALVTRTLNSLRSDPPPYLCLGFNAHTVMFAYKLTFRYFFGPPVVVRNDPACGGFWYTKSSAVAVSEGHSLRLVQSLTK